MKRSGFIFDGVNLFYYKCYKTNLNRSGSYIDSWDWIKIKKQQSILSMIMINALCTLQQSQWIMKKFEKIGKVYKTLSLLIEKYNSKETSYSSGSYDWKMFLRKIIHQLFFMCYVLTKWIYILPQIMKNKSFF